MWTKVLAGYRLPNPEDCPKEVHDVMLSCWQPAEQRPLFSELADTLDSLRATAVKAEQETQNQAAKGGNMAPGGGSNPYVDDVAGKSAPSGSYVDPYNQNATVSYPTASSAPVQKKSSLIYMDPELESDFQQGVQEPRRMSSLVYMEAPAFMPEPIVEEAFDFSYVSGPDTGYVDVG